MEEILEPAEGEVDDTIIRDETDANFFTKRLSKMLPSVFDSTVESGPTPIDDIDQKQEDSDVDMLVDDNILVDDISALVNLEYNFDNPKRGYALVINNVDFERGSGMGTRNGSDVDASRLYITLKKFKFDVKVFKNVRAEDMCQIINYFSRLDHSDNDCFMCFILSHGEQDVVYGTDTLVTYDRLVKPFKRCRSLYGKPKIFIIQACRGELLDPGITVDGPSIQNPESAPIHFPREADYLWVYATPPGHYAWRNSTNGSWFIQSFAEALEKYGKSKNLLHILAYANYICAYRYQSNALEQRMTNKKQSSNYSSRLTKDIYFRPK